MSLIRRNDRRFGCYFRCPKCGRTASILSGSIFTNSQQLLSSVLFVIYCWVNSFTNKQTKQETGVDKRRITAIFKDMRMACVEFVGSLNKKIGGAGKTVEIDETLIASRRYNRGRMMREMWVLGGICRETREVFLTVVPDRTGKTLLEFIKDHVEEGTTIHTDKWKGYDRLSEEGFEHFTVNHTENFVDPETGSSTQIIERLWRDLKLPLKRYNGIPREDVDLFLCEFVWRRHLKRCGREADFNAAIELLKEIHYS